MGTRIEFTKVPWDYKWPKVNAYTHFRTLGVELVKDEVARAAIKAGVAKPYEGPKPKRATEGTKSGKKTGHAKTAKASTDKGTTRGVGRESVPDDGGTVDSNAVDAAE